MKAFDLYKKRQQALEDVERARAAAAAGKPAGSLIDAAYAFVCGLPAEGRELAGLWENQLGGGPRLESREPRAYYVFSAEAIRLHNLELTRWLISGHVDPTLSLRAAESWETAIAGGRSLGPRADPMDLDAYMTDIVQAAEWSRGVGFYEREVREALKPLNLGRVQSERRLCYAICRQALSMESSRETVFQAVERLLKRQMANWLAQGQSIAAATWLKIRYAHLEDGGAVAEVLARAREYL